MAEVLRHVPLEDAHQRLGSKMVDFAGFLMPVNYPAGILAEHRAVREDCGVFDVSHMGELEFSGSGAEAFLEHVFTNNVRGMKVGQARYGMLCQPDGTIIDDDFLYKRQDEWTDEWTMVVNAAKTKEVYAWLRRQSVDFAVRIRDVSVMTTLLALQGPRALERIAILAPTLIDERLRYHQFKENVLVGGVEIKIASMTGYTGETGMEFMGGIAEGRELWRQLMEMGVQPCGLGARDTLRTEAGLSLGGHEISRELDERGVNPLEAGLGRFVDFGKEFIGREALARIKEEIERCLWDRQLVGFVSIGREIPRPNQAILSGGSRIGTVTSGTFSPTLRRGIGIGYVEPDFVTHGTRIQVDVRGKPAGVQVVQLPFYRGTAGRRMVVA